MLRCAHIHTYSFVSVFVLLSFSRDIINTGADMAGDE